MIGDHPLIDCHALLKGDGSNPARHREYLSEIADWAEPLTRQIATHCGLHFKDPFSRLLYRSIQHYANQEMSRVLNKYHVGLLLESMNTLNIAHTVVSPITHVYTAEDIAKVVQPFPKRLSMLVVANANDQEAVSKLEENLKRHRPAGVKLVPAATEQRQNSFKDLLDLSNAHQLPVFLDAGGSPTDPAARVAVESWAHIVAAFPRLSITITHVGWDQYQAVLAFAEGRHHLSVETSWQPATIIRQAVDTLGSHRVLLGSAFPLLTQQNAILHMQKALTPAEIRNVAARNAARLLGIEL